MMNQVMNLRMPWEWGGKFLYLHVLPPPTPASLSLSLAHEFAHSPLGVHTILRSNVTLSFSLSLSLFLSRFLSESLSLCLSPSLSLSPWVCVALGASAHKCRVLGARMCLCLCLWVFVVLQLCAPLVAAL